MWGYTKKNNNVQSILTWSFFMSWQLKIKDALISRGGW